MASAGRHAVACGGVAAGKACCPKDARRALAILPKREFATIRAYPEFGCEKYRGAVRVLSRVPIDFGTVVGIVPDGLLIGPCLIYLALANAAAKPDPLHASPRD